VTNQAPQHDNDPQTRLADALERLTREHRESVSMDGKQHWSRHDALLAQLRDAVTGNIGGAGGSAQSKNQRTPIDPDALEKYLALVNRIRDFTAKWTGQRERPVNERPEKTLSEGYRALHREIGHGRVPDSVMRAVAAEWEAWALSIEEKLSPPTTIELVNQPCPECGFAWFEEVVARDRTSKDRTRAWTERDRRVALTAAYRPDGLGGLSKSYVRCGCCGEVWQGDRGIRFVAHELENVFLERFVA